jgi:hypothetical protein
LAKSFETAAKTSSAEPQASISFNNFFLLNPSHHIITSRSEILMIQSILGEIKTSKSEKTMDSFHITGDI